MKIVGLIVGALLLASCRSEENKRTYKWAIYVCKASGCKPCGTFRYQNSAEGEPYVYYNSTQCEKEWEYTHRNEIEEYMNGYEDKEIRQTYGK